MKFIRLTTTSGTDIAVNTSLVLEMFRGTDDGETHISMSNGGGEYVITVKEDISTILRMIGQ